MQSSQVKKKSAASNGLILVRLTEQDIPALKALSLSVGWSHTLSDWKRYLHWAEEHAHGIKVNDTLVGCGLSVTFGIDHAHIFNIITHSSFRRQGLASKIFSTLLDELMIQGVKSISLDASDQGKSLYEGFGFHPACSVEIYQLDNHSFPLTIGKTSRSPKFFKGLVEIDSKAFGHKRGRIISDLIKNNPDGVWEDTAEDQIQGFLVATPRDHLVEIGPWIHASIDGARKLLEPAIISRRFLPGKFVSIAKILLVTREILEQDRQQALEGCVRGFSG